METRISDMQLAALLLAVDPVGLCGAVVRGRPGPARDAWIDLLKRALPPTSKVRRLPPGTNEDRLIGGLDIAATLSAGKPVRARGLLADCDGGMLIATMAERMSATTAALLGTVLDRREVVMERDGIAAREAARLIVIALDEGDGPDERPPQPLAERLAFLLDLEAGGQQAVSPDAGFGAQVARARTLLGAVTVDEEAIEAVCAAGAALGITSLRAPILALAAAKAHAALEERDAVSEVDVAAAARLVLAPRATRLPRASSDIGDSAEPDHEPGDDPPSRHREPDADQGDTDAMSHDVEGSKLQEIAISASLAALPPHVLEELASGQARSRVAQSHGRSGVGARSRSRGRATGSRAGNLHTGARLDVLATVRTALPWQKLRRPPEGRSQTPSAALPDCAGRLPRLEIRRQDFQIKCFKHRTETTTIFAVDASGSAALARLSEAKGAVELLLADCYVRRDQVALIAFGGRGVEVVLPPTRSLVRAKRCLAAMTGGGGTPLPGGLSAASAMAEGLARRGLSPTIVVLTDGRANVDLGGKPGRRVAQDDSLSVARSMRVAALASLLIDTSLQPSAFSRTLADTMGARYLPLPDADSRSVSAAVRRSVPR